MLAACVLAHFLNHVYTGALSPFLPIIKEELSLTLTQVGVITSAAITTMTAVHLGIGALADKGWRDILIPASVLATAIAVILTGLSTTFWFLVAMQILLGLGASGYHPSAFPTLAERFPPSSRASAVGAQAMGGLIGMALIPFVGASLMIAVGGWREALIVLGTLGIGVFVFTAVLMGYSRRREALAGWETEPEEREDYGGVDGWTRDYVVSVVLSGLRGIPFRSLSLLMPLYLVVSYGYEPLWAGALTTVMLGTGVVAEMIAGPLSDRLQRRVPFIVISPLLMAPCLLLLNYSLPPLSLLVVLMFIGFFYYFGVPPYQAYQTEITPRERRGLAFGILFSIGAIPGSLAPVIFGAIGDTFGLSASILFLAATSFVAAMVAATLRERPHRLRARETPVCENGTEGFGGLITSEGEMADGYEN